MVRELCGNRDEGACCFNSYFALVMKIIHTFPMHCLNITNLCLATMQLSFNLLQNSRCLSRTNDLFAFATMIIFVTKVTLWIDEV